MKRPEIDIKTIQFNATNFTLAALATIGSYAFLDAHPRGIHTIPNINVINSIVLPQRERAEILYGRISEGIPKTLIPLLNTPTPVTESDFSTPTLPEVTSDPEQRVIDLVNEERALYGLDPLVFSPELTSSARSYAQQLASQRFFSHVAPDGTTFIVRNEASGYRNWTYLEENLAAGQTTPERAVAAWMASPTHREDILSPNVHETGVGHFVLRGSPYTYYWVQEFGDQPSADPAVSSTLRLLARRSIQ